MDAYTQHAQACGIDMTGKQCVPVADCDGYIVAEPVLHPETLEELAFFGEVLLRGSSKFLAGFGVDYIIAHKPIL